MKIHIDLPWGGTFEMDCPPIQIEKFYALCGLAGAALLVALLMCSIR